MTEREAWLFLAEQWAAFPTNTPYTHYGVCYSITTLEVQEHISTIVSKRMRKKAKSWAERSKGRWCNSDDGYDYYAYPNDAEGARKRAVFCRRQAKLLTRKTKA